MRGGVTSKTQATLQEMFQSRDQYLDYCMGFKLTTLSSLLEGPKNLAKDLRQYLFDHKSLLKYSQPFIHVLQDTMFEFSKIMQDLKSLDKTPALRHWPSMDSLASSGCVWPATPSPPTSESGLSTQTSGTASTSSWPDANTAPVMLNYCDLPMAPPEMFFQSPDTTWAPIGGYFQETVNLNQTFVKDEFFREISVDPQDRIPRMTSGPEIIDFPPHELRRVFLNGKYEWVARFDMPPIKKTVRGARNGQVRMARPLVRRPEYAKDAFEFFIREMMHKRMPNFTERHMPKLRAELQTMASAKWKKMLRMEKKPYQKMATQDMIRYEQEVWSYQARCEKACLDTWMERNRPSWI